jgi:asparagine synthase (glutamine-hydrolysing)
MFADLVAHRRHRRALRETIAWARLRRVAAWPLLMDAIRTAHTRPASALHAWVQTLRTDPRRISQTPPAGTWSLPTTPPPAWVTRRTRDLAADLAADIANRDTRARGDVDTAELIAEVMHTVGRTARADIQLAEQHGIALHNPFLDSRVIDTYLAVPLDARPGPAQFKPLLRDAMRDLFPPILTARTTKGTFTSDYYGGIRTNLPALLILANGHLAAAGFVDPAAFRQTLSLAAAGIADAFTSVQHVVATEAWLRALDTATPVAWEPVAPNQTQGGAA